MKKEQCKPITVYSQQIATNKKLDAKSGQYEASNNGKAYKLPQEYAGDSDCAKVAY